MGDRERWDAKYAGAADAEPAAPEPFVVDALERLGPPPGTRALDLAAGAGRHALFLARRGCDVTAWDVSPVGLALLERHAREAGVAVATHAIDVLDALPEPPPTFELLVCVLFLDRDLLDRLQRLVEPGGHLVFATRTTDWPGTKPPERYRLAPGELEGGVRGFATVHVEERDGTAGIVARRETAPS